MSSLSILQKVTFGSDDAESDAAVDFFEKVFLKTSFYDRILIERKTLITGRKGSGKSAICLSRKKALETEKKPILLLTPKNISKHRLNLAETTAINNIEKFELLWKYVFLIYISQKIYEIILTEKVEKIGRKEIKELNKIRKFLVDSNELEKNLDEKCIELLNNISKFTTKVAGIEAGIDRIQTKDVDQLSITLNLIQENISKLLLIFEIQITILVDEIDEIWNLKDQEESKLLIEGIIKASKKISIALTSHINILLFLRSDIWDELSFSDKDKFRSAEERIIWSKKDLKRLITTRGKISADLSETEVDIIWNTIFEKNINNQESFEYIIMRTLNRPREIIQFCNSALSIAQKQGNNKILSFNILEAEPTYSNWKLQDLINEFLVQYPFLRDLLNIFQGYKFTFSKQEFEIRYEESKKAIINIFPNLEYVNVDAIIQILFIIGFLGGRINGKEIYYFDDPARSTIILPNFVDLEALVIHPAFHYAIGGGTYTIKDQVIEQKGQFNRNINIGGGNYNERIQGDYIQGNYYTTAEKQSLAEVTVEIQQLLYQVSLMNLTTKEDTKEAIYQVIRRNPTLKARLQFALKAGGSEALKAIFNHPLFSIPPEIVKGWLEAKS